MIDRAVVTERPPHALLLVGPPGVGKTTLALDLASGLLCLATAPSDRPCRECAACRKVDHGNHPDLHLLSPEGAGQQIRIGQVQALASTLALLPLEGRCRVAVIEAAHRLNVDAQNALLKTLEEPPPGVVLILAADESSSLLPTIVSRCARLRLGPVAADAIVEMLGAAGAADAVRGSTLARLSGGRPGRALIAAASPEAVVTHGRLARSLVELLAADRRARLAAVADLLDDGAALAALLSEAGEPPERRPSRGDARRASPAERRQAAAQVLEVWRDVARDLALAAHGARSELRLRDQADEIEAFGQRLDRASVAAFLGRLDEVGRALEAYANPELALDVLVLAWPHVEPAGR